MNMVSKVRRHTQLNAESRILDIGCGAGRFLIGLLATFDRVERYLGLDVRRPVIEWASRTLVQPERGNIEFRWIDVENERYNRRGTSIAGDEHPLPVGSESADIIVLFSVFSHMTLEDTDKYLGEIRRILAPGGSCYCTGFIEDGVPDWEENPSDYIQAWQGPLHCVRFSRSCFDTLVGNAGLHVDDFLHRHENRKQSTYILSRNE
jgi:SAM-dependent methyltransferase